MVEKFDIYDTLGILIPGVLVVCVVPLCFPSIAAGVAGLDLPDAFAVIALLSLSVFAGQLVQAIAGLLEPALYFTWGGRPSDRALTAGLGDHFPADSARRVRDRLVYEVGGPHSDRSLFLFAAQCAVGNGRVARFNSQVGYHTALLTISVIWFLFLLTAGRWGSLAALSVGARCGLLAGDLIVLLLFWYRGKQKALYYVREVLLTAERVLGTSAGPVRMEQPREI